MNLRDAQQFLNLSEYDLILNEVGYKPEWTISVFEDPYEGPCLYLTADVVDGYDHSKTVPLRIRSNIPPHRNREEFLIWLQWRLIQIEIHECREYFHVNGKPWSDPHDVIEPKPKADYSNVDAPAKLRPQGEEAPQHRQCLPGCDVQGAHKECMKLTRSNSFVYLRDV